MLLDMLNRPIKKGDTVLAKSYNSNQYSQYTVDKVAIKLVYITIPSIVTWTWNSTASKYDKEVSTKLMPRYPKEVIVVNDQIAINKLDYPEYWV